MVRLVLLIVSVAIAWIVAAQPPQSAPNEAAPAAAPPPCATPKELAQLSGTIVYEGDPVEGADPRRGFDIWVVGAPEWTPRLVVGDPGFDGHPAWSPAGDRIVYSAHGSRNPDLYVVNPDGANRTRLTFDKGRDDYPKWLAEGVVYRTGGRFKLIDPATGRSMPYELVPADIEDFAWSPDRSQLAVVNADARLYLAKSDGTKTRQLTNRFPREIHPFWSPDGKHVAYSVGDGRRDGKWDVYLLNLDTGAEKRVTDNPGADWACGWSPDGKWILITSEYNGNWDIYAIRPDGANRIRITCHQGNARYASWTAAEPLRK